MREGRSDGWILLIHQIPPKPDYLRVKVWRRLQRLGAVPIKNSVYVLPNGEQAQEDFQWVLRDIVACGGDASVCEARFVDGLSDDQVEAMFHAAREADYEQVAKEAQVLAKRFLNGKVLTAERAKAANAQVARLKKRFSEVTAIDFFRAPQRDTAENLLGKLEERLAASAPSKQKNTRGVRHPDKPARATWVTRKGIHVDRMASAWLIRRFIDPKARFKFVPPKDYQPKRGELRFDMFDAEFTHEGDSCTFEVLLNRFGLDERALRLIAEIVHDIDLKDAKYGREETPGVDRLIAGIAMGNKDDEARLGASAAVWDGLYEYFRRKGDER